MKLNTKTLLIILGSFIVLYVIVQFTQDSGKSQTLITKLVDLDTTEIEKIIINSPQEEVILSKVGAKWKVKVANGLRAVRTGAVNSMLNDLNGIKIGRLATKKMENWKDYQVDSTGTEVKVFGKEKLLANIVIGRMEFENQQSFYTFVRNAHDDHVYVANGFIGGSVAKTSATMRDNVLMRTVKDSLLSIHFKYPDSTFVLTRSEKWLIDKEEADSASVEEFLNELKLVTSQKFFDEEMTEKPSHQVIFTFTGSSKIVIDAFYHADGYIFRSSTNLGEAWLDEKLNSKILKSKSAFISR